MRNLVSIIGLLFIFQFSCKKNNNTILELNTANLQGTWTEVYDTTVGYFAYDRSIIVFDKDSFFIKISFADDWVQTNDPCDVPYWNEFAKGVYTISNSRLFLKGNYTDSLFVFKNSGCNNFGNYNKEIEASFISSGNVKFTNCKLFDKNSALKSFELKKSQ